jgi:homocysteine S-methyltransferase
VITANTFRTHARTLAHAGMQKRAAELTKLAVSIARDAADDRVWVAGSQSPLEDCYTPGLVPDDAALDREHHLMAENLAEAGVDLILAETQNTVREAVATCRAAAATGVPSFVSLVCGTDSRLLSGETITSAVEAVRPFSPVALLLNCLPADSALKPLRGLQAAADGIPVGIYANVGRPNAAQGWVNTDAVDPQAYSRYAADWLSAGAKLIGGCCGTTPEHIRALKRLIRRETGSG